MRDLNEHAATQHEEALYRAAETQELLDAVQKLIIPFIRAADEDAATKVNGHGLQQAGEVPRIALVQHYPPNQLRSLLAFELPDTPQGKNGLLKAIERVLQYSVNTWDQGFLDKLYSAITPVGLVSELVLASLNTNAHVYQVAPALISIEKQTGKALARLFGLTGDHAGGITQPGGSAANLSSIVIARNTLHPETKTEGCRHKRLTLFTSAHGHYSVEKAAQIIGLGSDAVRKVAVDRCGRMKVGALEQAIQESLAEGETPFYINATAGTTVLGSWDPLEDISTLCKRYGLWLHVDASWGGPAIFSRRHRHKLDGTANVDSISLCAHKMLSIPVTCTYLLGKDLHEFHRAMTLPAGYLFHTAADDDSAANTKERQSGSRDEVWDLADLTPQCGRRGDSLKLALSWVYYGQDGFEAHIDRAFERAEQLTKLVQSNEVFTLVSEASPSCLQVCFYHDKHKDKAKNDKKTSAIAKALILRSFMIDYAPGEDGLFFRVVVNGQTRSDTVIGLVKAIEEEGLRYMA